MTVRHSVRGSRAAALTELLDLVPQGLVLLDALDTVEYANPTAVELGLVVDGIANRSLAAQAARTRSDGVEREERHAIRLRRPVRRTVPVVARCIPMGEAGRVAVLATDATEVDRLEAVRRDFVANVGHELKTPVGALALLAEAVVDAADDPGAVRRFGSRMRHEAMRLGRLVADLIELSRIQGADPVPEMTSVGVDRVVAEAVDRSRLVARQRGIRILSGGTRGLRVRGDESQLITALGNLVDNAVAYSPDRTRVGVGIRRVGDDVEIAVADQGIGIAAEDQERIFERFYRVDAARSRSTGGTGLGLAIVKHIVHNHGGTVRVWSSPGGGSTFTLVIPAASPVTSPVTEESGVAAVGAPEETT